MKILFDLSTLDPKKVTGVGVYMLELLAHLSTQRNGVEIVPVLKLSRFRKKRAIEALIGKRCRFLLPWTLGARPDTLYHGPDFKLRTQGGLAQVLTVHDTVTFEQEYNHPDFYERSIEDLTETLNRRALKAVIVNSEFTRGQVLKHFSHLKDRTHVTHLGCDRGVTVKPAMPVGLPKDYLLFLGTLEKRKNVLGVIRAFEILKSMGRPEKLVLAGGLGFDGDKILAAIETSPNRADIVRLGYVTTENISALYQNARVLFFPSWYEGFGIPALEAMREGCPVVVSKGGALQEVCGDAALFVDPKRPEQMAETLAKLLADSALQADLKKRGLARAREFTWAECARKTIAVYQAVLKA